MEILADQNVPEEHVAALRGDGHSVVYGRDIATLGPTAEDEELLTYAEAANLSVLSSDQKDFAEIAADVAILVAPQEMSGGEVRTAVAALEALPADPAEMEPVWLSGLL